MRHIWEKPFNIKYLSHIHVCKTPESNMSLQPTGRYTATNPARFARLWR